MNHNSYLPPLPEDIKTLLKSEKETPAPNEQVKQQLYKRCALTLGLPVPDPSLPPADAGSGGGIGAALSGLSSATKISILAATLGIGGFAIHHTVSEPPAVHEKASKGLEKNNSTDTQPLLSASPPSSRGPIGLDAGSPEANRSKPSASPPPKQRPRGKARNRSSDATTDLQTERRLIEDARAFLRSENPNRALKFLKEHRKQFPVGTLTEEREALTILTLIKLKRTDAAERRAASFNRRFPHSMFRDTISKSLNPLDDNR